MHSESSESWKGLFKLAVLFLKSAKILDDEWTMGGGTVLAIHYKHRISKDVDIFFRDAQYITYLTPRLNDVVAEKVEDYDEQSNFLKLRVKGGAIDFIVAPNLTGLPPVELNVDGRWVRTDPPEEIVVKKIFYRAESLKARDIVDIAAVVKNKKTSLLLQVNIFSARLDALSKRLALLSTGYAESLKTLEILDESLALSALALVEGFILECHPPKSHPSIS